MRYFRDGVPRFITKSVEPQSLTLRTKGSLKISGTIVGESFKGKFIPTNTLPTNL